MTTLDEMIQEVQLNLLGFVSDQEQLTPLSSSPTSSATSFTVVDGTQISAGLIEVDDELMWCTSVDAGTNTVNVIMRGAYGTTAAAHASGTSICRNSPRFPRSSIKRAINDTIRSTYPDLFAADTTTITTTVVGIGYELPPEVEEILSVDYSDEDGTGMWFPVRRYRFKPQANTTTFASGKAIEIYEGVAAPRTVQVAYIKQPTVLSANSDVFTTVTGLQDSAKECIIYGACARLAGYLEPARLQTNAAEAELLNANRGAGSMLNAAKFFYQMHLQARAEESRRLQDKYPPRLHFVR